MNFVNKQISYFFPFRCFLMLFSTYEILLVKSYFFHLDIFLCFLVFFSAFWCFFVLVKSYRKKNKKFKTGLMTSSIILLSWKYTNRQVNLTLTSQEENTVVDKSEYTLWRMMYPLTLNMINGFYSRNKKKTSQWNCDKG